MKTKKIFVSTLFLCLAFLLTIFLPSCGENAVNSDRPIVCPESDVSFQNCVLPFLKTKCAYQGCHSSETMAGGRRMDDYFALFETSNVGLVIPGKPEQSRLYQIITRKPPHSGIDFPISYFSEEHIRGIYAWIKEGAKFN